jgi:hypothetical protein
MRLHSRLRTRLHERLQSRLQTRKQMRIRPPRHDETDRIYHMVMSRPVPLPKPTTKRRRSASELRDLARVLEQNWTEGDRVMTWLVRHEGRAGELTALLKDGWSWADISLAMQSAGIGYRPGTPINPQTLRQKACEARRRVRGWAEKENASRPMAVVPQPSPHFATTIAVGKSRDVATASANFSMSGARRCSGMVGINS